MGIAPTHITADSAAAFTTGTADGAAPTGAGADAHELGARDILPGPLFESVEREKQWEPAHES
jgi:hypothetical protein